MPGSSSIEYRSAYVAEASPGVTPAMTPGFRNLQFSPHLQMNTRHNEQYQMHANGRRTGVTRSGRSISGSSDPVGWVYQEYDPFIASLLQSSWHATNDNIGDGIDQSTFTFEERIPSGQGAGGPTIMRYRGVEVVGGSLTLESGADAMWNFDFVGMSSDEASNIALTGATYTNPTYGADTRVLGTGGDITILNIGGLSVTAMSLTVNFTYAGREEQPEIGNDDVHGITRGAFRPTISATLYVSADLRQVYNMARSNGAKFPVTIMIGTGATDESYRLFFPSCSFVTPALDVSESGPAFQQVEILPEYNGVRTVQITRDV